MKHLPICTPNGDISTFRIKLDSTLYKEIYKANRKYRLHQNFTNFVAYSSNKTNMFSAWST